MRSPAGTLPASAKLRIKGFRDANRALHDRLVETILDVIADGDHGLVSSVA